MPEPAMPRVQIAIASNGTPLRADAAPVLRTYSADDLDAYLDGGKPELLGDIAFDAKAAHLLPWPDGDAETSIDRDELRRYIDARRAAGMGDAISRGPAAPTDGDIQRWTRSIASAALRVPPPELGGLGRWRGDIGFAIDEAIAHSGARSDLLPDPLRHGIESAREARSSRDAAAAYRFIALAALDV